jgi:histidyl-tRNA synthetase
VRLNTVGAERSRERYRGVLLEAIRSLAGEIAPEAVERYAHNPLRIFDSKEHGEKLKRRLPVISDYLVEEDAAHFGRVREMLAALDIPFVVDPYLVRGLDYYTRTVFEIYHGAHGAQSALCGGGRYDTLVEACGGPPTPAVGFSAGLERMVEALPADSPAARPGAECTHYYVVCAGEAAEARALRVARTLRATGSAQVDLSGRSRKTQLEAAAKLKARVAVVVDAASAGDVEWHDLGTRAHARVAEAQLAAYARAASGQGEKQ